MVTPSDPYNFIVSESVISSSQEELLNRIPGWEDEQLNYSLTPPQPASQQLDIATLRCSARSKFEDASTQGEAVKSLSPCGLKEPLECASPNTEQEKEMDSYDAAFESDSCQSPSHLRHLDVPIVADLFSTRFLTQSQVGTENAFESQPSTSKDTAKCLKMDKILAKLQGAKTRDRPVDCLSNEDGSRDTSFKIRELGPNSIVPVESEGPRDNEITCSTRMHRKTTAVKSSSQSSHPKRHCDIPERSEPPSAMDAGERLVEVSRVAKGDAITTTEDNIQVDQCRQKRGDLTFKDADMTKPDMEIMKPEGSVHVHPTSFDDFAKTKSTSNFNVSARKRGDNNRKRTRQEGRTDLAVSKCKTKATRVNTIQGQTNMCSNAVQTVASHEIQECETIKQLSELVTNDTLKIDPMAKRHLQQPAYSAGSSDDQDSGRITPSAAELKCTARKTKTTDRGENFAGQLKGTNHSVNDSMCFPGSVIDVVMLCSGSLPLCKPDDPDFLSIVIGSGVSLPIPFYRGKPQ